MKRDLDLIRDILLKIENSEDSEIYPEYFVTDEYPLSVVNRHIKLLIDADYVEALDASTISVEYYIVTGITMSGYDYIDSIRDKKIWSTVKAKISAVSGGTASAALEVVKAVAVDLITKMLCQ